GEQRRRGLLAAGRGLRLQLGFALLEFGFALGALFGLLFRQRFVFLLGFLGFLLGLLGGRRSLFLRLLGLETCLLALRRQLLLRLRVRFRLGLGFGLGARLGFGLAFGFGFHFALLVFRFALRELGGSVLLGLLRFLARPFALGGRFLAGILVGFRTRLGFRLALCLALLEFFLFPR